MYSWLDDILILYYDFHSFLQSDAGVETNLLMMFKVFIVFWERNGFFVSGSLFYFAFPRKRR